MILKSALNDRRVWLAVLVLGFVGVLTRWALPANIGFTWVIQGGYWCVLLMLVFFGRAAWKVFRKHRVSLDYGRFEVGVLAGIIAILSIWTAHERAGYKVLADEVLLSGTAMSMHFDRQAAYPIRATDVQGAFQILSRSLDKRPLLYPFLVSTVHDLTGYRPANAFYLNMALGGVFLWLVYLLGWRITGNRWAGVVAMLLFAGLPLLAVQATGSGFELLNLLLITTFVLLVAHYLADPDEDRLEVLVFGALALASTRYESAVFLVPAVIAAVWGWVLVKRVLLSWPLMLSPVFLAPILLQNRMFEGGSKAWEMASQHGASEPFGVQYFVPNMGHALAFFFDFSGYQPCSPLFAAVGLLAMPFFALWIVGVFRRAGDAEGREIGWALAGVGLFAVAGVYMFYFWGKFDDPIISRLSLPVHLLMMISIAVVGGQIIKSDHGWKILSVFVLGGILFHSLPVLSKQAYRAQYSPGVEMQIRQDFLAKQEDKNLLFIDNDSFFWILNEVSASPIEQVQLRKAGLAFHLRNRSFREMYVFQSVQVNDTTGELKVLRSDDLGPDFELEPVMEKRVETLLFVRISRLKAIKDGGKTVAEFRPYVPVINERRTPDEITKGRSLYMENWLKQLP